MKPFMKYGGAKWSIADWIIDYLPQMPRYVEPYAGTAAVFCNLPWTPEHAILNDCSEHIVNLFRVMRTRGQELATQVAMTPWARSEYLASFGARGLPLRTGDDLEDARLFLVRLWQAGGTKTGTSNSWRHKGSKYTNRSATYELWRHLPDRLLAAADRLMQAEIECSPAEKIIARYRSEDTLLYCDPPYPLASRVSGLYQYEMTDADHVALLDLLDKHPGPVVLSGYHCELYDIRLAHWYHVERQTQAERGQVRTEVLWLNDRASNTRQLRML
jgi:DNA adenine methylase